MENRAFRLIGIIFFLVGAVCLLFALVLAALGARYGFSGGLWIPLLPLGTLALAFGGIGAGFLVVLRRRRRLREELMSSGRCVRARVSGVLQNRSIQVNGRHPYRLLCRYTDEEGTVHEFRSQDLDFNPEGLLRSDEVDVYFDPYNMDRYYVDVQRILPEIRMH